MNTNDLKMLAEYMGYEAEIRQGTFNTLNCYIQARGEKGLNHIYYPLKNNDQLVELIEELLNKNYWFQSRNGIYYVNRSTLTQEYINIEGKTLAEAVVNAAIEMVRRVNETCI